MCQVVNVRGRRAGDPSVVYVGRTSGGWAGSVLGNPFVIGKDGDRAAVIAAYKKWLWRNFQVEGSPVNLEVLRLVGLVKDGQEVILGCWCVPQPCHAEVVVSLIKYLI